jgi:hypothetical protein
MADFQYKSSSGANWADVDKYAYHGTYAGTLHVVYPEPQERTIAGRVCAAVGLPYIQLQSTIMTACGLNWWQSQFATSTTVDTEFWLSGFNPRTGLWSKWTGWLERPRYGRVQIGNSNVGTLYSDVEITLSQAVAVPV